MSSCMVPMLAVIVPARLFNSFHVGKFLHDFLSPADFFSKLLFFFKNTIRVSNSLDPDQIKHFVGPDQGPNCLQSLSADNTGSWYKDLPILEDLKFLKGSPDLLNNVKIGPSILFVGCIIVKQCRPRSDATGGI